MLKSESYSCLPIGSDLVLLVQFYSTLGLDAQKRDLLVPAHWLWTSDFTSEDDQFKTGQTREGVQKRTPEWAKTTPFYSQIIM